MTKEEVARRHRIKAGTEPGTAGYVSAAKAKKREKLLAKLFDPAKPKKEKTKARVNPFSRSKILGRYKRIGALPILGVAQYNALPRATEDRRLEERMLEKMRLRESAESDAERHARESLVLRIMAGVEPNPGPVPMSSSGRVARRRGCVLLELLKSGIEPNPGPKDGKAPICLNNLEADAYAVGMCPYTGQRVQADRVKIQGKNRFFCSDARCHAPLLYPRRVSGKWTGLHPGGTDIPPDPPPPQGSSEDSDTDASAKTDPGVPASLGGPSTSAAAPPPTPTCTPKPTRPLLPRDLVGRSRPGSGSPVNAPGGRGRGGVLNALSAAYPGGFSLSPLAPPPGPPGPPGPAGAPPGPPPDPPHGGGDAGGDDAEDDDEPVPRPPPKYQDSPPDPNVRLDQAPPELDSARVLDGRRMSKSECEGFAASKSGYLLSTSVERIVYDGEQRLVTNRNVRETRQDVVIQRIRYTTISPKLAPLLLMLSVVIYHAVPKLEWAIDTFVPVGLQFTSPDVLALIWLIAACAPLVLAWVMFMPSHLAATLFNCMLYYTLVNAAPTLATEIRNLGIAYACGPFVAYVASLPLRGAVPANNINIPGIRCLPYGVEVFGIELTVSWYSPLAVVAGMAHAWLPYPFSTAAGLLYLWSCSHQKSLFHKAVVSFFFSNGTREVVFCPHAVACAMSEFSNGTNAEALVSSTRSKLLRLACLPLPDNAVTPLMTGSEEVIRYLVPSEPFFTGPATFATSPL